jgi:hypothetical protein
MFTEIPFRFGMRLSNLSQKEGYPDFTPVIFVLGTLTAILWCWGDY